MLKFIIVIIISYIIGSIPFSLIFAKIFSGIDVRQKGSFNIGATNALVATGKKRIAILSGFFDILKGFAPVIAVKVLFGADIYAYSAGLFAILGHDFPVYLKFKGGKGVATTTGAICALNPYAIWFCLFAYLISLVITRYFILSTIIAIGFIPVIFYMLGEGMVGAVFGALIFILAYYVHRQDIERLLSGREKKLSEAVSSL